jgi:TonB family protein
MGQVIPNLTKPAYTFDFYGNQPGRWRVWASDKQGRESAKSPWRRFTCAPITPDVGKAPEPAPRVYHPGDGVAFPKLVYSPGPPYTDEARKAKVSGIVLLNILVGADGLVHEASVRRSLRPDLDESALRTVKTWRFEPGRKDGQPVAVQVTVEVSFNVMK